MRLDYSDSGVDAVHLGSPTDEEVAGRIHRHHAGNLPRAECDRFDHTRLGVDAARDQLTSSAPTQYTTNTLPSASRTEERP